MIPSNKVGQGAIFLVHVGDTWEWVAASRTVQVLTDMTGFRLGDVHDTHTRSLIPTLKQLIVESRLTRMANITNFVENGQRRCQCNRSGWTLYDEIYYTPKSLENAKDLNWTVERWYGAGPGKPSLIVSQRVRIAMLRAKFMTDRNFEPIHMIETDPREQYKFELPLDEPNTPMSKPR
jgi:hypothetical protein